MLSRGKKSNFFSNWFSCKNNASFQITLFHLVHQAQGTITWMSSLKQLNIINSWVSLLMPTKKTWDLVPLNSKREREKKEWDTADILELMCTIWRCPRFFNWGSMRKGIYSLFKLFSFSLAEMKWNNEILFNLVIYILCQRPVKQ